MQNRFRLLHIPSALCAALMALTLVGEAALPTASELLHTEASNLISSAKLEGDEQQEFSKTFLASEDWQHELLDSGPVTDPAAVVRLLFEIWKSDPSLATRQVDRQMATACALEGPRRNMGPTEMLPRYEFFASKWNYGLLNELYETLTVFERRYLARGVQHNHLNSIESMDYHNEEVCLPAEQYPGACWYARYLGHNPFGDTIQGPLFYQPFTESWGSAAEMIRNAGGVCGSLSNFGAAAALANGIPALTMGEPGHCAYAVMTKPGHWQPAYSLSWKRGTHTSFHGSTWGWHMLTTTAHQDPDAMRKSGDLRRLAKDHLAKGNVTQARETIQLARTTCPLDAVNWTQSIEILNASGGNDEDWKNLYRDLIKHLAPPCGEASFHFLKSHLYKKILPEGNEHLPARRMVLLNFHQTSLDWGLGRWNFRSALDHQLTLLGEDVGEQDRFMAEVFHIHAAKNIFTGEILAAQMARVGKDEKRLQQFVATIGKSLSKSGDDDFSAVIDTLARTLLPSAAARGDKATFQFIGKLTAKNYDPHPISPEAFPGTLLSSGGTFAIQQPGNRWDNPSRHWGVIEEHGGDFHTNATPATATAQLGNFGRITGVVIVTRGGNVGRLNGAILQTSTDGTTWTDVHTFAKVSQVQRIDLNDKKITAGYVRVRQPAHPSIHFHKFLVYGHKQN